MAKTLDHGDAQPESARGHSDHRPAEHLASWASLSAAIGASAFVLTWAFYTTFYARFGLAPEDVGLDFAAIGARAAFILLPWWGSIMALVGVRIGLHKGAVYLTPTVILGLATAIFCLYIGYGLGSSVPNAGAYAGVPLAYGLFLLGLVGYSFSLARRRLKECVGSGRVLPLITVMSSVIGLSFSFYGLAETASRLVATEAFQVQVRVFPDIAVLSVIEVEVLPSATSEGPDFNTFDGDPKQVGDYNPDLRLAQSTVLNRAIQMNRCLLFLGEANGVAHFWSPKANFGFDSGVVLSFPSSEIIVAREIGPEPSECAPIGQDSAVNIGLVELP